MTTAILGVIFNTAIVLAFVVRVMTRPHREPASRIAWIAVIAAVPVLGILAYILLGETNIGKKRIALMKQVIDEHAVDAGD